MTPTLNIRFKNEPEKSFLILENEIIIGRSPTTTINLALSYDPKISRSHAKIYYGLGTWWVEDLKSTNGTFVNGKRVTEAIALSSGDYLVLGDTLIIIDFRDVNTNPGSGSVKTQFMVNETQPAKSVREDKLLELLVKIHNTAAYSQNQQAMLENYLQQLNEAFPMSDRKTILIIEDRELIPRAYLPHDMAHISFTLARQAIKSKQAFHWIRQDAIQENKPIASSLQDTVEALYAPMLYRNNVIGVIHLDTTSKNKTFIKENLELLSIIANTIGMSINPQINKELNKIPNIFISYAHTDRSFVDHFSSDLRKRQIKVWFDERIKSGEDWQEQINKAIEITDAFVLILSPDNNESKNVKQELTKAIELKKKIFPIMYKYCEAPNVIRPLQYIKINNNYEKAVAELVERLLEIAK